MGTRLSGKSAAFHLLRTLAKDPANQEIMVHLQFFDAGSFFAFFST
jgi:hypothetical protein